MIRVLVPPRSGRWILNVWILFSLLVSIVLLALVTLSALEAYNMGEELREFRGVIEGIGPI